MKKLIAISVVFALVAGAAFAVDVTGSVIGRANVIEGDTGKDSTVKATGGMELIRLDGAGESGDGDFGGYIRFQQDSAKFVARAAPSYEGDDQLEGKDFIVTESAWAWWKPVDQFKLFIGFSGDGFWGKEGVTGWSFNQMANDGMAINYGLWYGNYWASGFYAGAPFINNRYVFFEGWNSKGAGMEITPTDMVGINIAIPFESGSGHGAKDKETPSDAKYIYQAAIFQVDLKLDFGNIAITYDGGGRAVYGNPVTSAGAIYAYAGLNVIENLGIDIGFSYHLTGNAELGQTEKGLPIGVGVGLKYTADSFGVKFRTTAALAGDKEGPGGDATYINSTVMPYFTISDNLAAFVQVGLGMLMPGEGDNIMGWFFNPYLRVGAEWGPTFYAGIKVETDGVKGADDKSVIKWSVPVVVNVSF